MAKLSHDQLIKELEKKKLTLDENSQDYKNLSSVILVRCEKGHKIETNLKSIRSVNFSCAQCEGEASENFTASSVRELGIKRGYRVLGIDNATKNFGVSIYEEGKLIFYRLLTFSGADVIDRLNQIRDMIENTIIPAWEPDYVQFENVQLQGQAFKTYEVLIMLIGLLEMSFKRYGIKYNKERSNVWRSHHNINGRGRKAQKQKAIKMVKQMYGINVGDDVAEAILIGKYRVDLQERKELKDLF